MEIVNNIFEKVSNLLGFKETPEDNAQGICWLENGVMQKPALVNEAEPITDSELNAVKDSGLNADTDSELNAVEDSELNANTDSGLNAVKDSGLNAVEDSGLNAVEYSELEITKVDGPAKVLGDLRPVEEA